MSTSTNLPRIDTPLRSSSFSSWYRIADTISSADSPSSHASSRASSPPAKPPPFSLTSLQSSSWRTASGSSAVSSVSLDLSALRPYRATNYPPFAGDEELDGEGQAGDEKLPPYFEGFDGGPYVNEDEEAAPAEAPAEQQMEAEPPKPREVLGGVLQTPWTSISSLALGNTGRWRRRMRVRAEVEDEFRRQQWRLPGVVVGEERERRR